MVGVLLKGCESGAGRLGYGRMAVVRVSVLMSDDDG